MSTELEFKGYALTTPSEYYLYLIDETRSILIIDCRP